MNKKAKKKKTNQGRLYITATFNNTLVNITDMMGNTMAWETTGTAGFRGSRKSTPFAATTTLERAMKKAKDLGLSQVEVYIKGPGPGRNAALNVLRKAGLKIALMADVTPLPHNGPRPKKRRRV